MPTRKYDRNKPAPLPHHMMLSLPTEGLPPTFDGRPWCGDIKDQGSEGACTGHAGASAIEWIFRKYKGAAPDLSPQYAYVRELIKQGSFPDDVGSDGTTLCEVLIEDGCCDLDSYPYEPGNIIEPTDEQDQNAKQYKMGAYHGIPSSQVAISVLGDPVPWPVEIGFTVYESFESESLATSGVMPIPQPDEQILGGHEVLIVGYDVGDEPTLRPASCPPAVLVQNSWGSGWGIDGFFWMPLEILDDQDTDLKIIHSGRPWKQ